MKSREIVRELHEIFDSKCVSKRTIKQWIRALSSSVRRQAKRKLGSDLIYLWDELNQGAQPRLYESKPRVGDGNHESFSSDMKRNCIKYICKCVREKKTNNKIIKSLRDRCDLQGIEESTIRDWIAALKLSDNREQAKEVLGVGNMKYWKILKKWSHDQDESKLIGNNYKPYVKRQYLESISECLRANKGADEIVRHVQMRYGCECVSANVIDEWIAALKSSNRNETKRLFGNYWIKYWDALHRDLDYDLNQVGSTGGESIVDDDARSMVKSESQQQQEMIEVKQESWDEFQMLPMTSSRDSLKKPRSSSSMSNRMPERIIGMANLCGQTYFMIKWRGAVENELGIF